MRAALIITSLLSTLALAKHGEDDNKHGGKDDKGKKTSTSTAKVAAPTTTSPPVAVATCNPAQFVNPSFESGVKSPWTTPTRRKDYLAGEVVSSNAAYPNLNPTSGSFWLQGQSGLAFAQTIDICPGTTFIDFKLRVKSDQNCEILNNGYPVDTTKPIAGGWAYYIDGTPDSDWQVLDFTLAVPGFSGLYSIDWVTGDCFTFAGSTFVDSVEIVAYR